MANSIVVWKELDEIATKVETLLRTVSRRGGITKSEAATVDDTIKTIIQQLGLIAEEARYSNRDKSFEGLRMRLRRALGMPT